MCCWRRRVQRLYSARWAPHPCLHGSLYIVLEVTAYCRAALRMEAFLLAFWSNSSAAEPPEMFISSVSFLPLSLIAAEVKPVSAQAVWDFVLSLFREDLNKPLCHCEEHVKAEVLCQSLLNCFCSFCLYHQIKGIQFHYKGCSYFTGGSVKCTR